MDVAGGPAQRGTKAMVRVAVVRRAAVVWKRRGSRALSSRAMEGRCDRLGGGRGSRSSAVGEVVVGGLRGEKRMGVAVEAAQDRLWEQRLTLANHSPARHAGLPKNRGGRGDRAGSVRPGNLPHLHTPQAARQPCPHCTASLAVGEVLLATPSPNLHVRPRCLRPSSLFECAAPV